MLRGRKEASRFYAKNDVGFVKFPFSLASYTRGDFILIQVKRAECVLSVVFL